MKLRWSIHQVYFYLVCFVTLILVIVGITNVVRAAIQIVVPIPEADRPMYERPLVFEGDYAKSNLPQEVIEEEAARREDFNRRLNREQSTYGALRMIISGLAQILVAVPVYLYHWRRIPLLA